jgi:hypothetical protein
MALPQLQTQQYDYPADPHYLKTDLLLQQIQEIEEQLEAAEYFLFQAEIFSQLHPSIFDTDASEITETESWTSVSQTTAATDVPRPRISDGKMEKSLRKGMTLLEALEIEDEIYRKLKEEIEEGRRIEASYWRFLDEDMEA